MPNIRLAAPYSLADDLLRPIRKLCDPSRRYSYETYFRADHIEVVAIDCGPVEKIRRVSVSKCGVREYD
jgi:hypothetical protein